MAIPHCFTMVPSTSQGLRYQRWWQTFFAVFLGDARADGVRPGWKPVLWDE
jgi:hypothetical protein